LRVACHPAGVGVHDDLRLGADIATLLAEIKA
jgi:hypothetical protein